MHFIMKDIILQTLSSLETAYDKASFTVKKKLNKLGPLTISPFYGYGNTSSVTIAGRLLEKKGIAHSDEDTSIWANIFTMLKRYESDEIPNARIQAVFQDQKKTVTTDSEGYFEVEFSVKEKPKAAQIWYTVEFTLLDKITETQEKIKAKGEIMIPPENAQFGVISDIDDTILISQSTDFMQKAKLTFLHNAKTRKPFEGVSAFYKALQSERDREDYNPIFYISSSPWNLYDLLVHFCEVNDVPKGPFLLRDMGVNKNKFVKSGHIDYKVEQIKRLFDLYPNLPFILIGDSGQKDAEIYEKVVTSYPGKILAIYIRDVSDKARDNKIEEIKKRLQKQQIPLLLCNHTEDAARHAVKQGWISAESIEEIHQEKVNDEGL
jgi:phosphatidate phosphatase APP1